MFLQIQGLTRISKTGEPYRLVGAHFLLDMKLKDFSRASQKLFEVEEPSVSFLGLLWQVNKT